MDVSSPVRGSSPLVTKTSIEEPEDQEVENPAENDISDVVQVSLEPEPEHSVDATPQSRPLSSTPRAQSPQSPKERELSPSSQKLALEDEDTYTEQRNEEAGDHVLDVATEIKYETRPAEVDEEILEQSISLEGDHQEVVSHRSTPAPREKRECEQRSLSFFDAINSSIFSKTRSIGSRWRCVRFIKR